MHATPRRCVFPFRKEVTQHLSDLHLVPGPGCIRRNTQNAGVQGLDLLGRLVAFQHKERVPRTDPVALLFEPTGEGSFFHGPTQARDGNDCCHQGPPVSYSSSNSRMARSMSATWGTTSFSNGGL